MKTYTLKAKEIEPQWHVRDADGRVLGRLASEVAQLLRGKHRPTFSPHMDHGDYVVIVNAGKVKVTGNKAQQKVYYRHSGYPGGLKETLMARMLETHPERVMQRAVKGMLPHNRLSRRLMRHLKIYGGPDHPHEAQVNAGSRQRKGEAAAEKQTSRAKAKAGVAEAEAKAESGEESA